MEDQSLNNESDEPPLGNYDHLPRGSLPQVISPYLKRLIQKTGGNKGPIGLQFVSQFQKEKRYAKKGIQDPLIEEKFEVVPGLIYKYQGRALWTVTHFCASYCRFCTRGREVGRPPGLYSDAEIDHVFTFIKKHSDIKEIILSGGDPLTTPRPYLGKIINQLTIFQKSKLIDVIRLGTRLPIHNPQAIQSWHYHLLAKIKNPYLMVHINHPAELTPETLTVLNRFRRQALANVLSQTVLLKNVNDSIEVLCQLFETMTKEGIRPYYVFQNDPVFWAKHFTVPIKRAIKLWQHLRPRLSGLAATARFVIDTPFGFGKVVIPEGNSWQVDYSRFTDFQHQIFKLK